MDKKALKIEPKTVGRYALGGFTVGASSAALLNLIRYIRELLQERKERLSEPETNEQTIVLSLPQRKTAEKNEKNSKPVKIRKVVTKKVTSAIGRKNQMRRAYNGTFGVKTATGWPTLTASAIAALASSALGAHVINEVYRRRRERQLKAELEAARQEYLDLLERGKTAECKEARSSTFGFLDYPLAAAALLSILGVGGTAYLTKRILDEKFKETKARGLDIPEVRRIVFRTKPIEEEDEEKKATVEDIDCVKTAIAVAIDAFDTHPKILETDYVKEAMKKAGTDKDELIKLAKTDSDILIEVLRQSPKLRRLIQRASMEQHPILKYFKGSLKLGPVARYADKRLYEAIGQLFGQSPYTMQSANAFDPSMLKKVQQNVATPVTVKTSAENIEKKGLTFGTDVLGSVLGSTIAAKGTTDELAEAIIEAQRVAEQKAKEEKEKKKDKTVNARNIALEASDPEAQAYLEANKARIMEIIKRMAAEGKL